MTVRWARLFLAGAAGYAVWLYIDQGVAMALALAVFFGLVSLMPRKDGY